MFGFLHIAMLAGLGGLALPVLAHLLSKRKFDVVPWGAMRFLELGRRTRRRIRLEEWLLLMLRMGIIAAVVLAVSRPWARGSLLAALGGGPSRDVAYVLDGSYSMGWEGRAVTPHAAGIQWLHESVDRLQPRDAAAILDARDQVRTVVSPLTSDLNYVRGQLDTIPAPTGTSHLAAALVQGLQLVNAGANIRRDVVVLTDGQALPWGLDDAAAWARLDTVLDEAAVRPRLWWVPLGSEAEVERVNYSVDRLQLSRELTVPEFTVRIQTTVRQSGGETAQRRVYFEVNGQRLDDKTLSVNLPRDGEATVQFEHQFSAVGSYIVSVVLDADHLPGDNRSDAAVVISDGLPVLLVDGDPQADAVRSETFFARSALTPQGVKSPWVKARVVSAAALQPGDLDGMAAVFLCNVAQLTPAQSAAVQAYVAGGGGVIVAPGDQTVPAAWNGLFAAGQGWLPAALERVVAEDEVDTRPVEIVDDSLQVPWLTMFREDSANGGFDLGRVRFSKWWRLSTAVPEAPAADPAAEAAVHRGAPQVVARFNSGDPAIVHRTYERGSVLLLAGPIDDAWSTLPGRRALAPLLHELVFFLAGHQRGRNVETGAPLILDLAADRHPDEFRFVRPDGKEVAAAPAGDELRPQMRLTDTSLAGVYRVFRPAAANDPPQFFVVNADRNESDLTPLSAEQREQLTAAGRFRVVETVEQLAALQAEDAPRAELWAALMCGVLGLLVGEIFLTRHLVQRGHESITDAT